MMDHLVVGISDPGDEERRAGDGLEPTAAWLQAGSTQAPSADLAPCPYLPIKIKKLISFCLPDRTRRSL